VPAVPPTGDPVSGAELAAFVAAVEARSVHGAADALALTQSAVTKRLQRLEQRLGLRLLDRSRAGVQPTTAGEALYPDAKQALRALQRVEATARDHQRGAPRELRLASSYVNGEFLVPDWLARFAHEHPGFRTQLQVVNSTEVLDRLRRGAAELGFVEGLDPLDDMESRIVARDRIVAVVGADHRWAARRSVRTRDLTDEPYVTREIGSGTRSVGDAVLAEVGITLVPTSETASTQAVKRALLSGGFSLLSEVAIADEVHAGSLVALPVRDVELERELRVVHPRGAPPRGAALDFWRWLDRVVAPTADRRSDAAELRP
jgi:DNA-binding transcriptional LysR family regulator